MICFGISSHEVEEWLPSWTPKAKRDIDILASWFPKSKADDIIVRPACKSDFNPTTYVTRTQLNNLLAVLAIRELPIKSFYVRGMIIYVYITFTIVKGIASGFNTAAHNMYKYNHMYESRALNNYPDLFWWNLTRILPKNPPVPNAHREWRTRQNPVFHQYHKNCYRYRYRKPRYIPWDGSQNQPVMAYLHENGTDVTNGTWKRNMNSSPNAK